MTLKEITENIITSEELRKSDIEKIGKMYNEKGLSLQQIVYFAYCVGVARGEDTLKQLKR